jgi:hypothetical protein
LKNGVFKILLESTVEIGKGHFGRNFCERFAVKKRMREEE